MLPSTFTMDVNQAGCSRCTQTEMTGALSMGAWVATWVPLGAGVAAGYATLKYVGMAYIPIPIIVGILTALVVSVWVTGRVG